MKHFLLPALALSVVLLHGCAMVPGQRMSERALTQGGGSAESGHVKLVQITADTLASAQAGAANEEVAPELLSYQPQPYRIGPGDSLYITVWDHPELTSPAGTQQQTAANGRVVRPDGTVFYPYVGTIKAAGMTIEELRDAIGTKLASFVEKPQVDVSVIGYGSQRVTLRGAFTKTDPQMITDVPLTLGQALGSAGINTDLADLSDLVLTRDGRDYHINLNASGRSPTQAHGMYLKPGDALYLPYNESREVYVLGEVIRPQAITFKTTGLNLTQVIGRAGGVNPVTADAKAIYVIRGVANLQQEPATVFHLNGRSPAAFALADNFVMRPGDVVFVGTSGVTEWNRVLSQLLPLSGIVGNAALTNQRLGN
ncbi:polysaccharide biosynthesis/export family protein [Rhodanobacter umsongensis]|uniref:Polysaccharide biosynthesis/export family protein n=1 Tax=Rhodanobacter umsongensis TaxID=633153 RepID=A0ABW0JLU7_9GAMM